MDVSVSTASNEPVGVPPKPWGIQAILIGLAVPVLLWASSLAVSVSQGEPSDLSSGEIIANLLLQIILLDGIFVGVPIMYALVRYRMGWGGLGLRPFDRDLWWMPVVAAAGAHVAIIAYSLILSGIGGDSAVPKQEDINNLFDNPAILPLTGLALVVTAPLAEELFFRGFIFAGLIRYAGVFWAMALSGLIFAAFHVTSGDTVGLLLPFTLVGMLFAWLYYRTGSLWTNIGAHLLFNLSSFVLLATGVGRS
jgi:membrane protease YdiL (CAAX protease family)